MIKNAIVKFLKKMGRGRNHRPVRSAQAHFESMEPRHFMSASPLMGINPQPPLVTYDSGGTMNYDVNTKVFAVDATPIAFRQTLTSIPRVIQAPKDIKFSMIIDNDGTLLSGVPGHDLIIEGRVDTDGNGSFDMDGVLLTGEIVSYGGIDSGATDQFDFIFTPTGGILVDNGFYNGKDIGLLMNSLNSFTFVGEFTNSFSGTAEGRVGPINAHLSSISGYTYYDSDNDGDRAGEAPIPGTSVRLTGTDISGASIDQTVLTDVNGYYEFTNLREGTYKLTETQPAGYLDGIDTIGTPGGTTTNDMFADINLPGGYDGVENNFGEILASSISGYVYYDSNNDGSRAGEAPIPGTPVTLTGTDDLGNPVNIPGVTNGSGYYEFTGLRPGTYKLSESQPAGYLDGIDTIGTPGGVTTNDMFSSIILPAGYDGIENNFGEILASSISGYVYIDSNDDGDRTGETPIENVEITLTGTDDLGNPVNITVFTGGTGYYEFSDLRPGIYKITESQPASFVDGKDTIGTPGGDDSANDMFSLINLPPGYNGVENNFGERIFSSISGYVYYDSNNDGDRTGETPIPGTPVTLTGIDYLGNPVNIPGVTDGAGYYEFTGLQPGIYKLTESQPGGYLDGIDTIGTPGGVTTNDMFSSIILPAGYDGIENNFGEILAASISGYVYYDSNNDGSRAGEAPIPGTPVTLTGTDDLGNPVNIPGVTNGAGYYEFTGLRPGTYKLTESQPAGYLDGIDTIGTPGGVTTNDMFSSIVLVAGFNGVENNFGEILASSISGYVYYDSNNDGSRAGEAPIPGTPVTLTGTDDLGNPVNIPGVTNGSGFYSFTGLRPGTYKLTETQPVGYFDGIDTIGTPGGVTTNDMFSSIILPAGFNGVENNFGEILMNGGIDIEKLVKPIYGSTGGTEGLTPGYWKQSHHFDDWTTYVPTDSYEAIFGVDAPGTPSLLNALSAGGGGVYALMRHSTAALLNAAHPNLDFLYNQAQVIAIVQGAFLSGDYEGVKNLLAAQNELEGDIHTGGGGGGGMGVNDDADTPTGPQINVGDIAMFTYVVTNTGDVELANVVVTDDMGTPGNPADDFHPAPVLNGAYNVGDTDQDGRLDIGETWLYTSMMTVTAPGQYRCDADVVGTPVAPDGTRVGDDVTDTDPVHYFAPGLVPLSSISGYVYHDLDNDGIFDNTENPISGTEVRLTGTDQHGHPVSEIAFTDSSGFYQFADLQPGTYKLTEIQPAGWNDGKDTIGTPGGATTNDMFSNIVLPANFDGVNNNFGEILLNGGIDIEKLVKPIYGSTGGTEGLTPGYWKQSHHFDDWTNYVPTDSYEAIFGVDAPGTPSLLNALSAGGGGVYALMRHSTAALLNAAHPNLDFLYNQAQVIALVQGAFLSGDYEGVKNLLAAQNELEGDIHTGSGGGGGMGVNDDADTPTGPQINVGDIAMFTYVVTNTGDVELANVVVTDDMGTPGNPADDFHPAPVLNGAYNVGDTDQDGRLDIGETWLYTSMMTVTAPGQYRCDADVVGTPVAADGTRVGDDVTDTDPVHYFAPGLVPLSSISGYVYHDLDNDGIFDNTENPIPGTEVRLTGTDLHGHPVSEIAFTDSSGFYQFADLQPGTYKLTEIQPAGWNDGKDTIGTPGGATTDDMFSNIVLPANFDGVNNNFGELMPPPPQVGTISGRKLRDTTGNGQTADDTGLGGVTIKLYLDRDGNGVFNATSDGPVYATDISDAGTGAYSFENLPAGKYFVQEVVPTGYARTGPILTDHYVVTLTAGETESGLDFVNAEKCDKSRVTNITYLINGTTTVTDLRGKTNEGDLVTVTFTVTPGSDVMLSFVSYTAPGASFVAADAYLQEIFDLDSGVFGPGTYTLTVTNPNSYYQIDFVCGPAIDRFGPAGSNIFYSPQMRLFSADNDGTKSVLSNPAMLSGSVYNDKDNDGNRDANEEGIGLVKINLWGTTTSGQTVDLFRYTEPDGSYKFDNLKPGTYKVKEYQPSDWNDGKDKVGSRGGSLSNDMVQNISLSAGNNAIDYLFGEQAKPIYQGLSASFWKSSSNFDEWCGYSTGQKFDSIFGCNATGNYTLLEALKFSDSSGQKALMREAVAALLNASNPKVRYFYSVSEVISMVKSAIQSGSYNSTLSLLSNQNSVGGVSL